MMEVMEGMPENVVAIRATGKVTGDDYERVLIPAAEAKLKTRKKIRMLYCLGPEVSGFTPRAMWDDATFGMKCLRTFERIAVVSDLRWIVRAVKCFAFLIPCPVRIFPNVKLGEAKTWVSE